MKPFSFLLAGAFCLALSSASAQGCAHDHAGASASPAKAKVALLQKELALSPEQTKEVEELLVTAEAQLVHQHAEGASAAKGEARYDATYDRIAKGLTAEQAAKFKQLRTDGKLAACGTGAEGGKGCAGHGGKGGCCAGKSSASHEEHHKGGN